VTRWDTLEDDSDEILRDLDAWLRCGEAFAKIFIVASALLPTLSGAESADVRPVLFEDCFQAAQLDSSRWNTQNPRNRIINWEQQGYVAEAISVEDGILRISLTKTPTLYHGQTLPFASGTVTTHGKFSFKYGRVEVRAHVPKGQGLWPAVWLLPESLEWPPEIDVLEIRGSEPDRVHMSHHWLEAPGQFRFHTGSFSGPDFSAGMHTFAIEWTPNEINWFVDSSQRHSATEHIPQVPMYLNVALAAGGQFAGLPDHTTPPAAQMEIDCIRVLAPKATP
jgi:beta-glucanase (GH16 family)